MSLDRYILLLSCPNQRGIVAAIAAALNVSGGNILEAHQFDDVETNTFFMRVVFNFPEEEGLEARGLAAFEAAMPVTAQRFSMQWRIAAQEQPKRVLILASKTDHCLADLLYRQRTGELRMEIVGVISNHPRETYTHLNFRDIPFHYLPLGGDKPAQEAQIWRIVEETRADLVVLARYMQILSNDLAGKLGGRCINIHHSFLPGFKGAKPYHQAHARGVKLIGATAHYVTAELDEGPIIEQDVERVSHADHPADLIRKGRDIERRVLARAVSFHLEDRILINGAKTVVFRD